MKQLFSMLSILLTIVFNSTLGAFGAMLIDLNPLVGVGVANALSFIPQVSGALSVKLTKEIWTNDIRDKFYPNMSFLNEAQDWSMWVENDTINFAEVGGTPSVLKNNTAFPIPVESLADTPLDIVLEYYTSKPTHMPSSELIELAYDKRTSVVNRHKTALFQKYAEAGAFNFTPVSDGTLTPVIPTTGSASGTRKNIKFADILSLKERFDDMDLPEDRVLVLNPRHFNQLTLEDLGLMKAVMNNNDLFGFKLYTYSKTPLFNLDDATKILAGQTVAPADQTFASFAFLGSEVMRALGSIEMFSSEKDPQYAGDLINFQLRALARSVRNKYIAAIYADAV